jgi:hypothetical protein
MNFLEPALKYSSLGYSVIPIKPPAADAEGKDCNKKPPISWKGFQSRKATQQEIKKWDKQYPNARIGIVTGKISNLTTLDCDSQEAREQIEEYLPDSLITPIAKSPRKGNHLDFEYEPTLPTKAGILPGLDIRNDGGYIICPPSAGLNGSGYEWLPGLALGEVKPAKMPPALLSFLEQQNEAEPQQIKGEVSFNQGSRDESLFHLALTLAKGGMARKEVETATIQFARNCKPPFPEHDALAKVKSAFERLQNRERNLTQEVRDWIDITKGEFQTRDIFEELNIAREQKAAVSNILTRLISENLIERTGRRTGCFRRIEKDLHKMDIFNTEARLVNISLPFRIDEMVKIMPGNVIIVAGAKDSGKTAFLLNIVADNLDKFNIHYFNSEMGEGELKTRLRLFDDIPFEEWGKINFYERDENFADVVVPGEGNLNIVDFLEVYEDFWIVKKWIAEIWRKLQGAVAIVALQKPRGRDFAFGGEGSIEKARLALAMDNGELKIISGKNWKTTENPKGKKLKYKVVAGCKLIEVDNWSLE